MKAPNSFDLINQTVMNVLIHSAVHHDFRALDALGVSRKSIERLQKLSLKGRYLMGQSPAPIIQAVVDNDALELYIERFIRHEAEDEYINQLILADAPLVVFERSFGMERPEYTFRRSATGMTSRKRGRPSLPDINDCPKDLYSYLTDLIIQEKVTKNYLIENPKLLLELSDKYRIEIRLVLGYFTEISKELI